MSSIAPPRPSSHAQKVIFGLIDAAEARTVARDGYGTALCITITSSAAGKKYRDVPYNLTKILGDEWGIDDVLKAVFPNGTKPGECEQHFCELFELDASRVTVKDRATLFFVLEKKARMPRAIVDADLSWVTDAVKAITELSLDAAQPPSLSPPSPSRSPARKKKRQQGDEGEELNKEVAERKLRLRQCMSGIADMSSEDQAGARAVLNGVISMMNGTEPTGSHRMGMEATEKYMATTLFSVLLSQMDSSTLFSSMAHLLASSQEGKEAIDNKSRTSTVTAPVPTAMNALLAPAADSTLPLPDEMAQSIIRSIKSDMRSNDGKAVTLSPSLNRLFGVMAVAQSKDYLNDPSVPPVITAYKAHDNNWPVKVIVLPSASPFVTRDEAKVTAKDYRYKKAAVDMLVAMPAALQVAITNRACDLHRDIVEEKVGAPDRASFRLNDEESDAIGVAANLSSTQEKVLNRGMYHARGARIFSPVDARKKKAKSRLLRKSVKFDKVSLYVRVKSNSSSKKTKKRAKLFRRYRCSLFELLAQNGAQLEQSNQLMTAEQRFKKEEWRNSFVFGINIDKGCGSVKYSFRNCCVDKPQSLMHTKLVRQITGSNDDADCLRDGFFSPDEGDEGLKCETEDLLNDKSVAIRVQHEGEVRWAYARNSGDGGHDASLPEPNRTKVVSDNDVECAIKQKTRFDFESADKSAYLVRCRRYTEGIAYYNQSGKEIGRIYFNNCLEAGRSPHGSLKANASKLRGFISSDFELLATLFGLVGGAAMHSCLWCEMLKSEYHNFEEGEADVRTLENIVQHYCNYNDKMDEMPNATKRDPKARKAYEAEAHQINCSVRRKPLLDIQPSKCICMPLHIILGVTAKLNQWFNRCIEAIDDLTTDRALLDTKYALKEARGRIVRDIRKIRREIIDASAELNAHLDNEEMEAEMAKVSGPNAIEKSLEFLQKISYNEEMFEDANRNHQINELVVQHDRLSHSLEDLDEMLKDMVGPFEREYFYSKTDAGLDETVYHHDMVGNDCMNFTKKYADIFDRVLKLIEKIGNDNQKAAGQALVTKMKAIWHDWAILARHMKACEVLTEDQIEEVRTYSIEIPRKLKDFVEDPPVELRKPLKYPEMVKVHCIAALHLYAVAREFNSIGIEAEESGEAIHARWNKLTSRFYGMRGGRKDKSAVLELERSQEPSTVNWIRNMALATQRYDDNKKAERKALRESRRNNNQGNEEHESDNSDDDDNDDNDSEDDNDEQNAQNNGQDEDTDDEVILIETCDMCQESFSSHFLPLHKLHVHSAEKNLSTKRLEKSKL